MTGRTKGRAEACGRAEAKTRLNQALMFRDVAALVIDESVDSAPGVAAALAVLAGIAAADAACCAELGERSRGQDHRQAIELVRRIPGDGAKMANDLAALLDIKDAAHYAPVVFSRGTARTALRRMVRLVASAAEHVQ